MTVGVVAVENLRDRRPVDRPEAVDLALEVAHPGDAGVDHADDDVTVAVGEIERAIDVGREKRPLVRQARHAVDRREERIVRHAQRLPLLADRRDIADACIFRRTREQRVKLCVAYLDQHGVKRRNLVRGAAVEAVLAAQRLEVLHRLEADHDLRAVVRVELPRGRDASGRQAAPRSPRRRAWRAVRPRRGPSCEWCSSVPSSNSRPLRAAVDSKVGWSAKRSLAAC